MMASNPSQTSGLGDTDRCGLVQVAAETLLKARVTEISAVSRPGELSAVAVCTSTTDIGRPFWRPRLLCRRQLSESSLSPRDETPVLRIVSFTSNHEVPRHEVAQQRIECFDRDPRLFHGVLPLLLISLCSVHQSGPVLRSGCGGLRRSRQTATGQHRRLTGTRCHCSDNDF